MSGTQGRILMSWRMTGVEYHPEKPFTSVEEEKMKVSWTRIHLSNGSIGFSRKFISTVKRNLYYHVILVDQLTIKDFQEIQDSD